MKSVIEGYPSAQMSKTTHNFAVVLDSLTIPYIGRYSTGADRLAAGTGSA